jgi:hypothetical protein
MWHLRGAYRKLLRVSLESDKSDKQPWKPPDSTPYRRVLKCMAGAGLLPQDADQTVHVLAMFVREHLKQRQRWNDTDRPFVTVNNRKCRHLCLGGH